MHKKKKREKKKEKEKEILILTSKNSLRFKCDSCINACRVCGISGNAKTCNNCARPYHQKCNDQYGTHITEQAEDELDADSLCIICQYLDLKGKVEDVLGARTIDGTELNPENLEVLVSL